VGVGQSETAVHSMVDFFLLLMLAGAGDELQGIKRGIMEMADAITINKADGNNIEKAGLARVQYMNALHLFPPPESGWKPKVLTCSAYLKTGISEIWETIDQYLNHVKSNNYFQNRRNEQAKFWMYETINEQLRNQFYQNKRIKTLMEESEKKVLKEEISSFVAAKHLLELYDQIKKETNQT
jgi:LAO/AO transport system kinase